MNNAQLPVSRINQKLSRKAARSGRPEHQTDLSIPHPRVIYRAFPLGRRVFFVVHPPGGAQNAVVASVLDAGG